MNSIQFSRAHTGNNNQKFARISANETRTNHWEIHTNVGEKKEWMNNRKSRIESKRIIMESRQITGGERQRRVGKLIRRKFSGRVKKKTYEKSFFRKNHENFAVGTHFLPWAQKNKEVIHFQGEQSLRANNFYWLCSVCTPRLSSSDDSCFS